MDPITHTMAGAVMARIGGDRRTPLAAATLILAANAPDIDIFSVWVGSFASLAFRRGWTHGPIALLLLPFVVTGIILAWDRGGFVLYIKRLERGRFKRPLAAPTAAVTTLDATSLAMLLDGIDVKRVVRPRLGGHLKTGHTWTGQNRT